MRAYDSIVLVARQYNNFAIGFTFLIKTQDITHHSLGVIQLDASCQTPLCKYSQLRDD
jgi:hypothetical protein